MNQDKRKILFVLLIAILLIIVIISIGVFVGKRTVKNNSNPQDAENTQKPQNYQEEIVANSDNHKDDFKALLDNEDEKVVIITTYSINTFNRTEYALGIKYSDFKNFDATNSSLKNESKDLTLDSKDFVQKIFNTLKDYNTSELIKLTDPKIVKIAGESNLTKKYSQYLQYFKDYKFYDITSGFATTLADDSLMLLENFVNNKGESKMFGIVLSKTSSGYLLSDIFPGETSIIIAFPPAQNKSPIIIANPVKGFERERLTEIGGSVLVPKGWYFRHETHNYTEAYFVSKEEIVGSDSMFETGLTMNVVKKEGVTGGDAEKYMNAYANEMLKRGVIKSDTSNKDDIFSYRDIEKTLSGDDFTLNEIIRIAANRETNTLYVIIFESTPEKWSTEWSANGKTIFDYISLDQTY